MKERKKKFITKVLKGSGSEIEAIHFKLNWTKTFGVVLLRDFFSVEPSTFLKNFFQLKFHLMRVQLRSNKNFANNGKSQVVITPLMNVKLKTVLHFCSA